MFQERSQGDGAAAVLLVGSFAGDGGIPGAQSLVLQVSTVVADCDGSKMHRN